MFGQLLLTQSAAGSQTKSTPSMVWDTAQVQTPVVPPLSGMHTSPLVQGSGCIGSMSQGGAKTWDATHCAPGLPVIVAQAPWLKGRQLNSVPCPSGQLRRPWKWFTRQTPVMHWDGSASAADAC